MEKLAVTCQVLYDNDLLDKQNEIVKIKKELNDNILPKILYKNYKEFETLKTEAIEICKRGVRSYIYKAGDFRFISETMRRGRVNSTQHEELYLILFEAFNKISKGQANKWISNYAQIINLSIINTIKSLVSIGLWDNIDNYLGREGLITFILKILMAFFDEDANNRKDTISVIRHFKCSDCDKITDYYVLAVKCWECSPGWHLDN